MSKKIFSIILFLAVIIHTDFSFASGLEIIYLTDTKPIEKVMLDELKASDDVYEAANALYRYDEFFDIDKSALEDLKIRNKVLEKLSGKSYTSISALEAAMNRTAFDSVPKIMLSMSKGGNTIKTLESGDITFHVNGSGFDKAACGIAAVFKGNSLYMAGITDLFDGSSGTITFENTVIDSNENYHVKMFAFDSLESMLPIGYKLLSNELYVSKNGNDNNCGTEEEPLETIEFAMEIVSRFSANMTTDISVNIESGEYFIPQTLEFNKEHGASNGHRIVYRGADGARPVISGGSHITGWTKYNDRIYCAPVDESITSMRNLYIDSVAAERAKSKYLYRSVDTYRAEGSSNFEDGVKVDKTNFPNLQKNIGDIELVWPIVWTHHRTPVSDIFYEDRNAVFVMDQPSYSRQKIKGVCEDGYSNMNAQVAYIAGKSFYIENAFELLDDKGEFYFDKHEHMVYYYPYDEQNMQTVDAVAPITDLLVNVSGNEISDKVCGITFENIDFKYGAWSVVDSIGINPSQADTIASFTQDSDNIPAQLQIEYANDLKIENCGFYDMTANAVNVHNSANNIIINKNVFCDIGGTAVRIGSMKNSSDTESYEICSNITVSDNIIKRAASEFRSCVGIQMYYADTVKILQNSISELPYSGISLGWGWGMNVEKNRNHEIKNNLIEKTMQLSRDGGAIYTLSPLHNTTISGNCLINNGNSYSSGGIYLDQGTGDLNICDNYFGDYGTWIHIPSNTVRNVAVNRNYINGGTDYNNSSDFFSIENTRNVSSAVWKTYADKIIEASGSSLSDTDTILPQWHIPYNEFAPTAVFGGDDGSVSVDGYSFIDGGEGTAYHKLYETQPLRMNVFNNEDWGIYEIVVPESGEYYLDFDVSSNAHATTMYAIISCDGAVINDKMDIRSVSWQSSIRHNAAKQYFSAGAHRIRFRLIASSGQCIMNNMRLEKAVDIGSAVNYDDGI